MRKTDKIRKKIIVPHLKEIREYFDLNQSDFAEFLGIEQNYFSRYENGIHEFPDELKIKLIDIIMSKYEKRININWFLTGEGKMFLSEKDMEASQLDKIKNKVEEKLEKIEAQITEVRNFLKEINS